MAISTPTPVPVGDVPGIPVQTVPLSAIDRAPDPVAVPGATGSIPVSQIDVVPDEVPVEFVPVSTSSGRQGPQGPTGPQGPAGPQGFTGATGSGSGSGSIGATGATGPQGATGTAGNIGATGLEGATGPQGNVGATGVGSAGATGPQGDTGATGPQGNVGATGISANTGNITFDQSTIETNQSNAYLNLNSSGSGVLSLGTNDEANVVIVTDSITTNNRWTFDSTGNLTFPGNAFSVNYANGTPVSIGGGASTGNITFVNTTISAPNDDDINIQALDGDGVLSSGIAMRPSDTYMRLEQWGGQDSQSFTTADWGTGTYTTQGGGSIGAVEFTNAANIINFVDSLVGVGHIYFSVNGGPQLVWDGSSAGGNNITFLTPTLPDTDPTTVTSFEYFYSYFTQIEIDYDAEEFNIEANKVDLTLSTTNQRDIALDSARDLDMRGNGLITLRNSSTVDSIQIQTDTGNTNRTWAFGTDGALTLPLGGNIVGQTADNSGSLHWVGNSSGDGNGYTTIQLIPDATLTGTDQYLIVDPTAGGHVHLRAGGTQDNSSADLFLGGENSFVKIAAGANSDVFVRSNSNDWRFGTDGVLTLPAGEGILQSTDDTISLVSFNTTTGNANSVYLGSGGGLGFNDQEIGGNWLEIFRNGAEPEIRVPVGLGNLNIQTAEGNTAYNWTFDNTGNLTLPGSIIMAPNSGIIANGASPAPSLSGFNSLSAISVSASGNISATGNVTAGNISVSGATNISNVTINSYTSVPRLWFKGELSAPQNVVSSTDTVTIWNTNADPLGWGNVTTGHIVPNKAGWYDITSRVQFDTNATANSQQQLNHQIAVNGNQQSISQFPNLTANVPVTMITTAMVELNGTTDYITTTCWSGVAGNAQQINGANASMILVRWVSN